MTNDVPLLASIPETARMLRVGRSTIYRMLADQTLEGVKIGGRHLVRVASIRKLAAGEGAGA